MRGLVRWVLQRQHSNVLVRFSLPGQKLHKTGPSFHAGEAIGVDLDNRVLRRLSGWLDISTGARNRIKSGRQIHAFKVRSI